MLSALQKSMNYCEIQYFIKYYYTHSVRLLLFSDEFLLLVSDCLQSKGQCLQQFAILRIGILYNAEKIFRQ